MAADPVVTPNSSQPAPRARKQLIRRSDTDHSQRLRLGFQLAFVALNLWIGAQFYIWVRHVEKGIVPRVARPDGVEGWLPIAALMNLKAWLVTGGVPAIHPAAMFILVAVLAISLLLKKAFCSWLCPVGTLSEALWKLGRVVLLRNFDPPRWLDIPLRGLKYLLLSFFVWAVVKMPADQVAMFMQSPYGAVADVKMLNFFRFMGTTAFGVIGFLVVMSMLVKNFWCRYLCPYGALLGIVSLGSPAAIRRDPDACIDCAKCTKVCPSRLPVDRKLSIRSAECTMCMTCVAVCPAKGALEVKVSKRRALPAWAVAAAIAAIFVGVVGAAKATGHWKTDLPLDLYRSLVPNVENVGHP